jgi:predicted peptidase
MIMYRRLVQLALLIAAVNCGGSDGPSSPVGTSTGPTTPTTPTTPVTPTTPALPINAAAFNARTIVDGGITWPYQVFVPAGFDKTKKYEVIVVIHSSGERGTDNQLQANAGLAKVIKNGKMSTWPAVTVFPQVGIFADYASMRTAVMSMMPKLLDSVLGEFSGDPNRIVLTGFSMGALLGYDVSYGEPTRYASFMPISGGICAWCITGDRNQDPVPIITDYAIKLKSLTIVDYNGTADANSNITALRQQKAIFDANGAHMTLNELLNQPHGIWDGLYASASVQNWLLSQHK